MAIASPTSLLDFGWIINISSFRQIKVHVIGIGTVKVMHEFSNVGGPEQVDAISTLAAQALLVGYHLANILMEHMRVLHLSVCWCQSFFCFYLKTASILLVRYNFQPALPQKWVEHGEDLTAMLPVLSVFMGHKSMQGTSRHLRLTAEVYPDAVRQVVSPHVLRHSKAMRLLQSGVNLVCINLLLSIRRPAFLIGNSNDFAFIHEVLPPFFGYSHSRAGGGGESH